MNTTINLIKKYATTSLFTKLNLFMLIFCSIYWIWIPTMSSFGIFYCTFYFCLTPFFEEESTKSSEQLVCMPVKRSQIVLSKYLCNTGILIFLSITSIISTYLSYGFDNSLGMLILSVNVCGPILMLTIFIPLGLKFGMNYLKLIILGTVFVLAFGSSSILTAILNGEFNFNFGLLFDMNINLFFTIITIISVILYLISIKISITVFKKREYK